MDKFYFYLGNFWRVSAMASPIVCTGLILVLGVKELIREERRPVTVYAPVVCLSEGVLFNCTDKHDKKEFKDNSKLVALELAHIIFEKSGSKKSYAKQASEFRWQISEDTQAASKFRKITEENINKWDEKASFTLLRQPQVMAEGRKHYVLLKLLQTLSDDRGKRNQNVTLKVTLEHNISRGKSIPTSGGKFHGLFRVIDFSMDSNRKPGKLSRAD